MGRIRLFDSGATVVRMGRRKKDKFVQLVVIAPVAVTMSFALGSCGGSDQADSPSHSVVPTTISQPSSSEHTEEGDQSTSEPGAVPSITHSVSANPTVLTDEKDTCDSSGTSIGLDYDGGAAGSVYYLLTVTNIGTGPCQLVGYPDITALGSSGEQIGMPAQGDGSLEPITLTPGQVATATVQVTNPDIVCAHEQAKSSQVRVTLPEARDSVVVDANLRVCTDKSSNVLVSSFEQNE